MDVRGADGTTWRVTRVWWKGRPKWRRPDDGPDPTGALDFFDDPAGILVGIAVAAVLFLAFLTVLPAVIFLVEALLLVVLALVGLLGRVVFRRPWTIRGSASDGRVLERQANGWRASGRVVDEVAAGLRAGRIP